MKNKEHSFFIYVLAIILFIIAVYTFANSIIITYNIINGEDLYQVEKTEIKSIITEDSGEEYEQYRESFFFTGGIFYILTLLIITVIFIILGIGILQRKNWARIIVIIISIFAFLDSFSGVISGYYNRVPELIIYVSIATYLITSKKIKDSFKKNRK